MYVCRCNLDRHFCFHAGPLAKKERRCDDPTISPARPGPQSARPRQAVWRPQPTISLIESGRLNPTEDELKRLGRALGVPAGVLMRPVTPDLSEEMPAGPPA